MKIKNLKNYDIPSCILNIWEKHYSPYLLPVQEEAVKNYGILSCVEGSTGLPRRFAPRNDKKEETSRNHPHPALSPQGRRYLFFLGTVTIVY